LRINLKRSYIIFFVFVYTLLGTRAYSQVKLSGNIHTEYAFAEKENSRFLENWTDLSRSKGAYRVGGRFSFSQPPAVYSQQDTAWGMAQRFVEYSKSGLNIRVGNFYGLLGRGLILRSFDNRTLRWDSNIDGLKIDYRHDFIDTKFLTGKPRKSRLENVALLNTDPSASGKTFPTIYGGEIRLKPIRQFHFGSTFIYSEKANIQTKGNYRGSLFTEFNPDFGSFYGEYAALPYPSSYNLEDGSALYLSGNIFVGNLDILAEYKSYNNFAYQDGLMNNPPTVIREHLFTLLNRNQLVQNANDESGYFVELAYPLSQDGIITTSYSRITDARNRNVYQDMYGQLEKEDYFGGSWIWATGRQEEFTRRYLNFVSSATYELGDYYSIKMIYEHLHARDAATEPDRQYYDQLVTIGLSKAPLWTLSFLGEHSTDHTVDDNYVPGQAETKHFYWAGGQLDLNLFDNFNLSVFGGTRRQGKICIGGVCVVKPELNGVEVTGIWRF
jgi:hypothetical protein